MLAVDTNVLVRYVMQDDAAQSARAATFLEDELPHRGGGYVSIGVVCEFDWVLSTRYRKRRPEVADALRRLLISDQLTFEHEAAVLRALDHDRVDIADAVIHEVGRVGGCKATVTFDRRFAGLKGVEILLDR